MNRSVWIVFANGHRSIEFPRFLIPFFVVRHNSLQVIDLSPISLIENLLKELSYPYDNSIDNLKLTIKLAYATNVALGNIIKLLR